MAGTVIPMMAKEVYFYCITKGFTAMQKGESPAMIVDPIVRRFPKRVKAKKRFLIYDNACMARKVSERRFPHKIRHWTSSLVEIQLL